MAATTTAFVEQESPTAATMEVIPQTDLVRQKFLRAAENLERRFTPRAAKRIAAIVLRNATIQEPHCNFCGTTPKGAELHESPFDATVRICDYCARYFAQGGGFLWKQKLETWHRLKDFAP
jgi:hypothetical protein